MTLQWKKQRLLGPSDVASIGEEWEVVGVFNPGVAMVGQRDALLLRIAVQSREKREGCVALPRWDVDCGPTVDWVPESDVERIDPRVVRLRSTGLHRLTFISYLELAWVDEDRTLQIAENQRIEPMAEWEEYGVEDARITQLEDRYWITYAAASRHGVVTALASTSDFESFEPHRIILPLDNKDVTFFPERIEGRYFTLHRPSGSSPLTRPAMWSAWSDDLIHWGGHKPFYSGRGRWESGRVGAGPPPIRTSEGWLAIYHGNRLPTEIGEVGRYQAAALLLDATDPERIVRHSHEPILSPEEPFEREGFVPDVVFPTGITHRGEFVSVYYGVGDALTAVAEVSLDEVLGALRPLNVQ